jgi:hypothetical protein
VSAVLENSNKNEFANAGLNKTPLVISWRAAARSVSVRVSLADVQASCESTVICPRATWNIAREFGLRLCTRSFF